MKRTLLFLTGAVLSGHLFPQACDSLFSQCVSTFSRQGYYFDLEAVNQVEITGFSIMAQNGGTRDMAVYYRPGTYLGNEGNASAWTLLGTQPGFNPFFATTCPITTSPVAVNFNVCIPQGQRYGFYVVMSSGTGSIESHNTLAEGSIGAQDANLRLITGKGQNPAGLFTGTLLGGLTFQGGIQYSCTCTPTGISNVNESAGLMTWPVPASGELFIALPGDKQISGLSIFDPSGKRMHAGNYSIYEGKIKLDVSGLNAGMYFYEVEIFGGKILRGKFLRD